MSPYDKPGRNHAQRGRRARRGRLSPQQLEQKRAERAEKVAGLLAEAADKSAELATSEGWLAMLRTAARFPRHSFNNQYLIAIQAARRGITPTRVAGYRTWQSLGRQVRKGEQGLAILAPIRVKAAQMIGPDHADDDTAGAASEPNDRPGDRPSGDRGRGIYEVKGFKTEHVWDISQTDGPPLPEVRPQLLDGQAPEGAIDAVTAQIHSAGYRIAYDTPPGGADGVTDPTSRTVTVRADVDPAEQLSTLVHELAHIRMHISSEPGADLAEYRQHRDRAEIEAESVAYVVLGALGMDTSGYTIPYVTGWAGSDPKRIRQAASAVTKTAHQILEPLDTSESAAEARGIADRADTVPGSPEPSKAARSPAAVETTGLDATLEALNGWIGASERAVDAADRSILALRSRGIGTAVVDALGEARSGIDTAVAALSSAREALCPSEQIRDAYHASPDAGSKSYLTDTRRPGAQEPNPARRTA